MNIKKLLLGVTGVGFLAGGLYALKPTEYIHEPIKVLSSDTRKKVLELVSPFGDTNIQPDIVLSNPIILQNGINSVQDIFSKNPNLKKRIQNMSWYQDFLSGVLTQDVYEKYLYDAQNIENILIVNSELLEKIQHEPWWQRYITGDINPTDMLSGNITSFLYLQDFKRENPELYTKIQRNPLWSKGIPYGENHTVIGIQDLLTSASLRVKQLDTEPGLKEELARFGFSPENIFTDNWSQGQGIYGAFDIVRQVLLLDSERKDWFLQSEIGKQYLAGKVDWIQLEQFLER